MPDYISTPLDIDDWARGKPTIRAFGSLGPIYVDTQTFGSGARKCMPSFPPWPVTAVDELPGLFEDPEPLPVPLAVKPWEFSHANARIREDAKAYKFRSINGKEGSVYTVRLATSDPCEDEMAVHVSEGIGGQKTLFAGIYDGHGGWATASTLQKCLVRHVSRSLRRLERGIASEDVDSVIAKSFTELDAAILGKAEKAVKSTKPCDSEAIAALAPVLSGSCALLSIFDPQSSMLRVACVGDSRAVLGSHKPGTADSSLEPYEAKALSEDQTGSNKREVDRVEKAHPGEEELFAYGRLLGIMVTRGFGDHRWKWEPELVEKAYHEFVGIPGKPNIKTPPYLTAEPVITTTKVETKDFLIMASDGLWEHISSEDAVLCISEWLKKKTNKDRRSMGGQPWSEHGRKEYDTPANMSLELDFTEGYPSWTSKPEHFVVEDMDNAAVHLLKNILGGKRRSLFIASTMLYRPLSRNVRDDITVQVIFFGDIQGNDSA